MLNAVKHPPVNYAFDEILRSAQDDVLGLSAPASVLACGK